MMALMALMAQHSVLDVGQVVLRLKGLCAILQCSSKIMKLQPGQLIAAPQLHLIQNPVSITERQRYPDLSSDELAWRVTRRMQGNPKLGR